MKTIVVGGAGFIGSNLVDLLIKEGHEVIVVDDLSTGKRENINSKAKFYQKDITKDFHYLLSIATNIDCVFHLAAWARVPRSIEDPIGTNNVNVGGTLNIMQICRQLGIPRLVYSSSSSVYGDQDSFLMQENMTPSPKSPYGLQKLIGEQYADMFGKLFDTHIVSLRYFNVYGPRQLAEGAYSLVIGKFIEQKAKGKKMTIYGDGNQTRAYTHVYDVVRANLLAATQDIFKTGNHQIFNIGTNEETSVNTIAEMLGGGVEHIIPNPRGAFEELRKAADFTRASAILNWRPSIFIKEGMKML